jgi:hypothetical protein
MTLPLLRESRSRHPFRTDHAASVTSFFPCSFVCEARAPKSLEASGDLRCRKTWAEQAPHYTVIVEAQVTGLLARAPPG